jgi:2-polyprenyl-3-methyl-5-hydroxy-6-metoxy-1,4-benzoquinol methylase
MFVEIKKIQYLKKIFKKDYPYFSDNLERQISLFGRNWINDFNNELEVFFGENKTLLNKAIQGYVNFALEAMKLQIKFNKTKKYDNKTYTQAASEVYLNERYMMDLYLPGIYLSHYLWKHHYRQLIFFKKNFLKYCNLSKKNIFYDIGIGTGFYSKCMLQSLPNSIGVGFDFSPFSIKHTKRMIKAFKCSDRYKILNHDITKKKPKILADHIICIEVLEHLERPQFFLNHLFKMMKKGGYGLISAAINAPNQDHIYLYKNYKEVQKQLKIAGFKTVDFINDKAYKPRKKNEIVPENVAFIITK